MGHVRQTVTVPLSISTPSLSKSWIQPCMACASLCYYWLVCVCVWRKNQNLRGHKLPRAPRGFCCLLTFSLYYITVQREWCTDFCESRNGCCMMQVTWSLAIGEFEVNCWTLCHWSWSPASQSHSHFIACFITFQCAWYVITLYSSNLLEFKKATLLI